MSLKTLSPFQLLLQKPEKFLPQIFGSSSPPTSTPPEVERRPDEVLRPLADAGVCQPVVETDPEIRGGRDFVEPGEELVPREVDEMSVAVVRGCTVGLGKRCVVASAEEVGLVVVRCGRDQLLEATDAADATAVFRLPTLRTLRREKQGLKGDLFRTFIR